LKTLTQDIIGNRSVENVYRYLISHCLNTCAFRNLFIP